MKSNTMPLRVSSRVNVAKQSSMDVVKPTSNMDIEVVGTSGVITDPINLNKDMIENNLHDGKGEDQLKLEKGTKIDQEIDLKKNDKEVSVSVVSTISSMVNVMKKKIVEDDEENMGKYDNRKNLIHQMTDESSMKETKKKNDEEMEDVNMDSNVNDKIFSEKRTIDAKTSEEDREEPTTKLKNMNNMNAVVERKITERMKGLRKFSTITKKSEEPTTDGKLNEENDIDEVLERELSKDSFFNRINSLVEYFVHGTENKKKAFVLYFQ